MPAPPPPPGFQLDQPVAAAPPPPPGFKLDAGHPPPPTGFTLDQNVSRETDSDNSPQTAYGKAAGQTDAFLHSKAPIWKGGPNDILGLRGFGRELSDESRQNYEDIKGDFTAPLVHRDDKTGATSKPGVLDYGARAGKAALDIANRPFVPLHAVSKAYPGRVSEEHGGPSAESVATATDILTPFAGTIRRAAPVLAQKLTGGAAKIAAPFEKVFSPTTIGPKAGATERVIRKAGGETSLQHEKAADELLAHNKLVGNLPVQQQREMISSIEAGRPQADPKLQPAADAIRKTYDGWRDKVKATLPASQVPNFIDNYYAHIWKEKPSVVGEKLGTVAKQGSGRNFKQRTLPTIEDGLKAGLTPKFENPIESTLAYSQNMSRYVATHDMLGELKNQGYAKWYGPGSKNIPQGWKPLAGIMTSKTAPVAKGGVTTGGRPIQLFAPPEVARVFNNFISKGMEQGDAGPIYEGLRKASNGMTMLKLGLSTYHLGTMANEAMISDYARAFRAASRGEGKTAAKAFASAPVAPVKSYLRGLKMQKQLLDKAMPDAMSKKVNDAFVRSGQTLKMDPYYRARASGSFYDSFHKGTLKKDVKEAASKIYTGTPWEKAKGTADLVANAIQTTAAPLFEHYIPAVKRGAFASEMEDWLKTNPTATQEMIDKEAVKVADSIDNRFGELNNDNLFWDKKLKQAGQIALLSPTWNLGTIREIGGGLKDVGDISAKEGLSRRTAYVAGLAFNTALMSSIYQYLKTGKAPEEPRDLMAPKTGGRDATSGQPERAMTPGYQKDVYAFGYDFPHHVLDEAANKLNPFLSTATGLAENKDYRGLPIYRPHGATPVPGDTGRFADYLTEQFLPISANQYRQGAKKGSNIGMGERTFSIRPAPGYITDPDRTAKLRQVYGDKDWKRKIRADERAKAQRQ